MGPGYNSSLEGQRKITRSAQAPKRKSRGRQREQESQGVPWGVAVFGDCSADGPPS